MVEEKEEVVEEEENEKEEKGKRKIRIFGEREERCRGRTLMWLVVPPFTPSS